MLHKKSFKNFAIVLMVINFVIYKIHCENECNCDSIENENDCKNCNQNCVYKNSKCIYCQDLISKPYYKITDEGSNPSCETIKEKPDNTNYKLIYNTKEFTNDNCPDGLTSIGDICYESTQLLNLGFEDTNKKYYYTEKKDGFTYMIYVEKCPYKYQFYDEIADNNNKNQCLETCTNCLKRMKRDDNTFIFRCSQSCHTDSEPKEYIYEYQESTSSTSKKYCLDECPSEAKYIFDNECKQNCGERKFLNEKTCLETCENSKLYVDTNKQIILCPKNNNPCPDDYPYIYDENYCLKSCKDTNSSLFEEELKKVTYLNESEKKCLDSQSEGFIDEIELKWVENCKSSSAGPYWEEKDGKKYCKRSCDKIEFDTLKCVTGCGEDFIVKDSNFCYSKCPGEKNFYNSENTKECRSG